MNGGFQQVEQEQQPPLGIQIYSQEQGGTSKSNPSINTTYYVENSPCSIIF